jgi:conjugative relaxase-like TrwC/TraI family protein
MLSIQWIQSIDYYLDQATADYYFRPGEPPGRWFGKGAKALGLIGFVTAEQLRPLAKGFSPAGRALIHNAGSKLHRPAWDLTFSAPKSVSVFWSQADRATRLRIGKLHHKAIKVALDDLNEVALFTRRGKNGMIREEARPIVAVFEHSTSRELDPNLHSHCVLFNLAERQDGKFGAILSQPFYRNKLRAGAIYRAELAHLLKRELGLRIEREETGFGIVGVPQKLVKRYSSRRTQIEDHLKAKGFHSAKAASVAARRTRKAKPDRTPPRGELLRRWRKINSTFGFTEKDAQRLLGRAAIATRPPCLKKTIALGVAKLLEIESYFSEQLLIRYVACEVVGEGISAARIIDEVREYLACDPDLVSLGTYRQEAQYTTREMLELEKELFALIREARNDASHRVPDAIVQRLLDERLPLGANLTDDELARNTEQRKAVLAMTRTTGAIKVLEGMAGTGKTYVFSIVKEAFEKAGYDVQGMALSAVAARNLEEGSGAKSQTIAKRLLQLEGRGDYVRHHKRQLKRLLSGKRTYAYAGPSLKLNRKSAMIVDEAGMVGTRRLLETLGHIRKAGAVALLAGDRLQLQPIEAGGPFIPIANLSAGAELSHVIRQKLEPDDPVPAWHRQAGKLIAHGKAEEAIKLFRERGRFRVYRDLDQALLSMVRNWSVQGASDPNNHICLAGTRAAVAQLNAMCQSARVDSGALGSDSISINDYRLYVDDTVLFTKNSLLFGVKNGDRGVVLGFNHLTRTMAVRLYATSRTVLIPYRRYQDIQLGYAMTTHKAQGSTVPGVHVLLGGPMQDLHLSYVQSTRACESTRLYVDKLSAGPKLKHIIKQMTQARLKKLAHDVIKANPSPIEVEPEPSPPTTAPVSDQQESTPPSSSVPGEPIKDGSDPTPESATNAPQQLDESQRLPIDDPKLSSADGTNEVRHSGNVQSDAAPVAFKLPTCHSGEASKPLQAQNQPLVARNEPPQSAKHNAPPEPQVKPSSANGPKAKPKRPLVPPPTKTEKPRERDDSSAAGLLVSDSIPHPLAAQSTSHDSSANHTNPRNGQAANAVPLLPIETQPQDVFNLPHVSAATINPERYGPIPSGIVVERKASNDVPVKSVIEQPQSTDRPYFELPTFQTTPPPACFPSVVEASPGGQPVPTFTPAFPTISRPPSNRASQSGSWGFSSGHSTPQSPDQPVAPSRPLLDSHTLTPMAQAIEHPYASQSASREWNVPPITVASTTQVPVTLAAVERYGKLPGGIVVEGEARCDVRLKSLAVSSQQPTRLLINGTHIFETGLSAEEVALLWHAVLETGQAAIDFGVLLQTNAVGIDRDSVVAVTMMHADNALGRVGYGFDSQYRLADHIVPSYQNPFVEEATSLSSPAVLQRAFVNYLYEFSPKFFWSIQGVNITEASKGVLGVTSMQVKTSLALIEPDGTIMTTPNGGSLAAHRFPLIHKAFQDLSLELATFAKSEPSIARTLAYATVVSLLRHAKSAKAALVGSDHVRSIVKTRQHFAIPRFDYTLRSKEYSAVALEAARLLSASESTWFDGLMATVVGLKYAALAGDQTTFLTCKAKALKCITQLRKRSHFGTPYHDVAVLLPALESRIRDACSDVLVDNCLTAAFLEGRSADEKRIYLHEALSSTECTIMGTTNDSAMRCRWLEITSYLYPAYDVLRDFIGVRRNDPLSLLPYSTLKQMTTRGRPISRIAGSAEAVYEAVSQLKSELKFSELTASHVQIWQTLTHQFSDKKTLYLLDELQRCGVSLRNYLSSVANLNEYEFRRALSKHLALRLHSQPATAFYPRLLLRKNPFMAGDELLDFETAENLDGLFAQVRPEIENVDPEHAEFKNDPSARDALTRSHEMRQWWSRLLDLYAVGRANNVSKVAVMLGYELKLRGLGVRELYAEMKRHQTKNAQAALFYWDYENTKTSGTRSAPK